MRKLINFEITIPVLNEEISIESKLNQLLYFLKYFSFPNVNFNIVIADNGSTDSTLNIVKNLSTKNQMLSYIHISRPGVGLALKQSWGKSNADILGYMDLDLATDLKHLNDVCIDILCNHYDMVVGNRLALDAVVSGRSITREITSRGFNKIVQIFIEPRILDGMCGFKFMTKSFATKALGVVLLSDNWIFSTQLLCVAFRLKGKVKHLPIKWTDDYSSKVKIFSLAKQYIIELYQFKKELKKIG